MYEKNHQRRWGRWIGLGVAAGLIYTVGLACRAKNSGPSAPPQPSADSRTVVEDGSIVQADASNSSGTMTPSRTSVRPARSVHPPKPLTPEAIAELRGRIASADGYGARIEARRSLFHQLRKHGQLDLALPELNSLLDEVERREGRAMAQRVAFSIAGNLVRQKDHNSAIGAYTVLLERYGDGPFAAEALLHLGSCRLELHEYVEAEKVWRRLIEGFDETAQAPWGWRKLALAQLLQGKFEKSLATLEMMAGKYAGTQFGEYARMRQGYVLMAAGRLAEAKASYADFLTTCSNGKYCRLAQDQLAKVDQALTVARADGRQR